MVVWEEFELGRISIAETGVMDDYGLGEIWIKETALREELELGRISKAGTGVRDMFDWESFAIAEVEFRGDYGLGKCSTEETGVSEECELGEMFNSKRVKEWFEWAKNEKAGPGNIEQFELEKKINRNRKN